MTAPLSIALERIMPPRLGSVDPSAFPDEEFDLYSIPAFDKGEPEILGGTSIGSAKQIVQPGDVLLSRIVPHIRRAWVVGRHRGRRIIASGEWIVFRGEEVDQKYLRHVLVSDPFHSEFMRTVSGVGGSLLRARPSYVAKIRIPLPPLPEQQRIAAILDKADALRAMRRAALAHLDTLTQSIFLDMFADSRATADLLSQHAVRVTKGTTPTTIGYPFTDFGIPLLRVQNLRDDQIDFAEDVLYVSEETHRIMRRSQIRPGDVLTTIAGTIGRSVVVPADAPEANCNQAVAIITPKESLSSVYLCAWLRSRDAHRQVSHGQVTATISNLSLGQIRNLRIPVPSMAAQERFATRVAAVRRIRNAHQSAISGLGALFASLQHGGFVKDSRGGVENPDR